MFADKQTCLVPHLSTAHVPGRQGITCLLQRHAQLSRLCGPPTQHTLLPLPNLAQPATNSVCGAEKPPVTAFAVQCCLSTDSAELVLPAAGAARRLSLCATYTAPWTAWHDLLILCTLSSPNLHCPTTDQIPLAVQVAW
jgi:hypothetical protein